MSVLLAGLDPTLTAALARRLLAAGDQVRMIGRGEAPAGVHVAAGELSDEDLVERACQGVRTIVLGRVTAPEQAAALAAAGRAGVDRVVLVGGSEQGLPPAMSWISLIVPEPRFLGIKKGVPPDAVAEAVDAADDLAGEPRLVADLGTDEGWRALRLEPPR
ncbi:MAG TPA: hypothetical protein VG318_03655 [Actinomycetota bacterium]|nr:hypothetical protein [Actinomycetota bacterium]